MASSKNKTAVRGSDGDGENGEADLSQDVEWLSSLSESELDFLIGLKELVTRRAKNAGCKDLAEKFDARMLHALGIVLMEHFKAHAESASITTNVLQTSALLRECNLATPNREKNPGSVTISEDIRTSSFVTPRRKRMWEGLCEERASSSKKRKTARKLM
ncbi:uncharacterized protein [Elaeis guineensis]|uniref:Uncharacterized protein LOC105055459 n=1 Tax=Elaeis guineensis var. tenera TaxID=51953 RepID=A0A6I9S9B5_ELAGV|nr:uncharacterized protein LOC105055459 [Elaeis guineensis]